MTSWVSHDGALGFLLRHVPAQAAVLGAEEGLGAAGAGGGLAEGAADVGVAAAGGVLSLALAAGLPDAGGDPGPGAQVPGGREGGSCRCRSRRSGPGRSVTPKPGMPSSWATCRSYGSHRTAIRSSSTAIWAVSWSMLSSIICRTKACSGVKNEQSRASSSWAILRRIRSPAFSASTSGSRSPAMTARSMSRPDTPWMSLITDDSFRCASSSSFSQRSFSAVRAWISRRR